MHFATNGHRLPTGLFFAIFVSSMLSALFSGCDFFGKQVPITDTQQPGTLADGTSIVGSWSASFSSESDIGQPTDALTETYSFDPNGAARVEVRDNLSGGGTCVAFGQYRVVGAQDVVIFVQAAVPSSCPFDAQIRLSAVKVESVVLRFTDPKTQNRYAYFIEHAQQNAPVGVWDFDGAGAINGEKGYEYVFIDPHGYFRIQTTINGAHAFWDGFYSIEPSSGTIYFNVFDDANAPKVDHTDVYSQFITDGNALQLITSDPSNKTVIRQGRRL